MKTSKKTKDTNMENSGESMDKNMEKNGNSMDKDMKNNGVIMDKNRNKNGKTMEEKGNNQAGEQTRKEQELEETMEEVVEYTKEVLQRVEEGEKELTLKNEKIFLMNLLPFLKTMKLDFYWRLLRIGNLSSRLGDVFGYKDEEYLLACYYSNISLLSVEHLLNKVELTEAEFNIYKRHIFLSADFLEKRNLKRASEIALNHHEKPNATGYQHKQSYPKESAFINIADEFIECILPNQHRPQYTLKEALNETLKEYIHSTLFNKKEVEVIKAVLAEFYEENL
ncbi:hypothetical protein HPMG_01134 [Helicobacter pullorum MIT 98-5489]|uniref:HD-GYP domain-containing protein n=4 Tax=Helicobacter pullorum TaxID=35818 RepID=C5F083_9HELI|nr:HD domain-containing phosphohydrolase [Helicobacter pullorum]EEQ63677.1 hypothetical protein HPMG_01134 [Helicobacter pullorum MIT 98-5489]KPH55507.1 hypothetical protein HPU229334_08135 [Helicobacter pullorum]